MNRWLLSGTLCLALFAACSESGDAGLASPDASVGGSGGNQLLCTPGEQVVCACPGGAPGAQRCRDDGSGYESCLCPDAGTGGGSGSGGSAGQAGGGAAGSATGGTGGADPDAGVDASAGAAGTGGTGGTGVFLDATIDTGSLPDAACTSNQVTAEPVPANVLYLIDRTGSMNCNPPPTQSTSECNVLPVKKDPSQPSKWEITLAGLTNTFQQLQTITALPSVGLALFNNDDYCGFPSTPDVSVEALSTPHLNELVLTLNAVTPKGSTPIIGATMAAYSYIYSNSALLPGNRLVVLLTDGGETCDVQAASKAYFLQKAQEATVIGIRTVVLGAPGSELDRAFLSQIAYAGGTAASSTCDHSGSASDVGNCHRDMTLPGMNYQQELQKNLDEVIDQELGCELYAPESEAGVIDPNKVNVVVTSGGTDTIVPHDTGFACSDPANTGWQWDASHDRVFLCGSACEALRSDPQASVSYRLGCATIVAGP